MSKAQTWLQELTLEAPQVAQDAFVVFPLTVASANGRDYLTLDEAYRQGLVVLPESGRVPEIVVTVKGEKPVLIVEGEVIVGGWQNRTVNISLLLEAGKEHHIPVSCVEQGRWGFRSRHFYPEPTMESEEREREREFEVAAYIAHASLRHRKTAGVLRAYRLANLLRSEQGEVWAEVGRKLMAMEVDSPTADATSFYARYRSSIRELLEPMTPLPNQVGAVIAIGKKVVGIEAFDHPETWQLLHRKVLSGYAADALEALRFGMVRGLATEADAAAFRAEIANALGKAMVKKAPVGLGEHYLLDGETGRISGFALVHNEKVHHLFAFPTPAGGW